MEAQEENNVKKKQTNKQINIEKKRKNGYVQN